MTRTTMTRTIELSPKAGLAGALAGLTVDLSLFPIDTVKTRLQAERGFWASGGFREIYKGIGSISAGSAPSAALFFLAYESCSQAWLQRAGGDGASEAGRAAGHMVAASVGEVLACAVRVPTEVVKQRAQAYRRVSSRDVLLSSLRDNGLRALYRGYGITILREIPFTVIQFPTWEYLKRLRARVAGKSQVHAGEAAVCGSIAGAIAAAVTTPLDVIKTRVMLERRDLSTWAVAQAISREGTMAFMRGVGPRVAWISAGGAIFLGTFEAAKDVLVMVVI